MVAVDPTRGGQTLASRVLSMETLDSGASTGALATSEGPLCFYTELNKGGTGGMNGDDGDDAGMMSGSGDDDGAMDEDEMEPRTPVCLYGSFIGSITLPSVSRLGIGGDMMPEELYAGLPQ